MATMLKEVDAVCIGVGFTGSILARELTKAGLKVVGLERGPNRTSRDDFSIPSVRDDLKYAVRHELFQDTQMETVSLRHSPSETALPIRRLGSFLPGTGLGGAGHDRRLIVSVGVELGARRHLLICRAAVRADADDQLARRFAQITDELIAKLVGCGSRIANRLRHICVRPVGEE